MTFRTNWTPEVDAKLAEMINGGIPHRIVAKSMKMSEAAASHRASRLGLRKPPAVNLKQIMKQIHAQGSKQ